MSNQMFKTAAEKEAAVQDLFLKTAAASGMDIDRVPDADVVGLYQAFDFYEKSASEQGVNLWQYPVDGIAVGFSEFLGKLAGDEGDEKKEEEEKKKKKEEEKKAALYLHKLAEEQVSAEQFVRDAETFGKIAAHSYVAEIKKMANDPAAAAAAAADPSLLRKAAPYIAGGLGAAALTAGGAYGLHKLLQARRARAAEAAAAAGAAPAEPMLMDPSMAGGAPDGMDPAMMGKAANEQPPAPAAAAAAKDVASNMDKAKGVAKAVGKGGLALGGAYGLYRAGKWGLGKIRDKREAPAPEHGGEEKAAFDRQAAEEAFAFLVEGGVEPKVASYRLTEALQSDIGNPSSDNVKTAALQNPGEALAVRAAELISLADFEF